MGTGREIVRQFKTRKLQYLGHLIRYNSSLQLIEGNIEARRSRGRPRNTWTTDITTTNGMKYYQLKRAAEDIQLKKMAWTRCQPRTRDDTSVKVNMRQEAPWSKKSLLDIHRSKPDRKAYFIIV